MKAAGVPLHCWGSKGVVRACRRWRVWVTVLPRRSALASGIKREVAITMLFGGGVWQGAGVGGAWCPPTPPEMTTLAPAEVPWRLSLQGSRMDVVVW